MCLGVPGLVVERSDVGGMPMATVDVAGVSRSVCLACTPDADVGDYVVVHAGFAIARVDEREARAALDLIDQIGLLDADAPDGV